MQKMMQKMIGLLLIVPLLSLENNINFDEKRLVNKCSGRCCPNKIFMDQRFKAKCSDNVTPLNGLRKCQAPKISKNETETLCGNNNGFCEKGVCCPALNIEKKMWARAPFVTSLKCDPNCPLPINWTFAFCGARLRTVVILGTEKWYNWEPSFDKSYVLQKCKTARDCPSLHHVCANLFDENLEPFQGCIENPMSPRSRHYNIQKDPVYFVVFLFIFIIFYFRSLVHS